MPDSKGNPDKLTDNERCLHYIATHAEMYGSPPENDDVEHIMEAYQDLTIVQTNDLLKKLEKENKIKYWRGKYTEGWIIKTGQNE